MSFIYSWHISDAEQPEHPRNRVNLKRVVPLKCLYTLKVFNLDHPKLIYNI